MKKKAAPAKIAFFFMRIILQSYSSQSCSPVALLCFELRCKITNYWCPLNEDNMVMMQDFTMNKPPFCVSERLSANKTHDNCFEEYIYSSLRFSYWQFKAA